MAYRRSRGLTLASGWQLGIAVWVLSLVLFSHNRALGAELSLEEKQHVRALVMKQGERLSNLFVKIDVVYRPANRYDSWEWAMSGEKRYRKRWWAAPVGEPLPGRWGIAVWDGQLLKAYDSELDNGSIRAEHDSTKDQPRTYSPYLQVLGSLNHGTLAELFARIKLEHWKAEWVVPEKVVLVSTDYVAEADGAVMEAWHLDLQRGGLIVRHDKTRVKP